MKGVVLQPLGLMMRTYLDGPPFLLLNDIEMRMQEMEFWFSRVAALNIEIQTVITPTVGSPTSGQFGATVPRGVSELSGGVLQPINLAQDERDLFRETLPDKPGTAWSWSATVNYSPSPGNFQFDWFQYLRQDDPDFFDGWYCGLRLDLAGAGGVSATTDAASLSSPILINDALAIGGIDLPLAVTYAHMLPMYYESDPAIASVSVAVQIYPSLFFQWTSRTGTPTYNLLNGARLTP